MRPGMCAALILLGLIVTVSGCFKMGPDYTRPEVSGVGRAEFQHGEEASTTVPAPRDKWWEAFNDRELNRCVEEALNHNLDIKKASARILELRYEGVRTRASRFPGLTLEGSAQRTRQTVETVVPAFPQPLSVEERKNMDSHNLSLAASFELDLWGRLARSDEAATAEIMRAEEDRRTIAQGIVAETVTLYLTEQSLQRRIRLKKRGISEYENSLNVVKRRYKRGIATILDLRQARRALAGSEAELPPLIRELGGIQQDLGVLMGRYPETRLHEPPGDEWYRQPEPVPAGLPSELLIRRPDVRAAEASLRALNASVGVAKASRFPAISLTGSYGYTSDALTEIFQPENELLSIALGLVQPVFDAGKLKAAQRAAEARYKQGVSEYAKTVLNAFAEVERALLTRQQELERRRRIQTYLEEAKATQEAAVRHYLRGLVDYLSVIDAQQLRLQAEESLILVELAVLTNRVSLYRALGGGWAELEALGDRESFGMFSIFER